MKKVLLLIVPLLLLASCKDSEAESNVRQNWPERNVQWFAEVYDAARAEIETAKAQYGNDWEEHCDWRVYKTLLKSQDVQGPPSDYVVCKINEKGDGDWSPAYTDSVRLYYRGWIMDDNYPASKDNMTVFSQTYYGEFNPATAAPVAMAASALVEGFTTAIQYMVEGDDWSVYIPNELAYGAKASDAIPAYSTLLFRIRVERVHKSGTGMPGWR
jgi:FKBP-type peptidyl-prolyl cis-trans isomerase FklB